MNTLWCFTTFSFLNTNGFPMVPRCVLYILLQIAFCFFIRYSYSYNRYLPYRRFFTIVICVSKDFSLSHLLPVLMPILPINFIQTYAICILRLFHSIQMSGWNSFNQLKSVVCQIFILTWSLFFDFPVLKLLNIHHSLIFAYVFTPQSGNWQYHLPDLNPLSSHILQLYNYLQHSFFV